MSLLKYLDERMVPEVEEDELWAMWLEIRREGISTHSDDEIRDLHANFVAMLAEAELQFANFDGQKETKKLHKEITEINLLNTKYNDDEAMNSRLARTKADEKYQEIANQAKEYEMDRALWKGRVNACSKVVECLSREISYRIKK